MNDIRPPRPRQDIARQPARPVQASQTQPSTQPTTPPPTLPPIDEPSSSHAASRRPKKRRLLLILGGIFIALVAAALAAILWFASLLGPLNAKDDSHIRLEVVSGTGPKQIAQLLEDKKVIKSAFAFDVYTRFTGTRDTLKAGNYSLSPSESVKEIVAHLQSGKTDEIQLTFLPGATVMQNKAVLVKAGYSEQEVDAAFAKTYTSPLFESKPAGTSLEGYIYGETYTFSVGSSVEQILQRVFAEYESKIKEHDLVAKFKAQGFTLYEGITMASIVQREVSAKNPSVASDDQKQVAQIFLLRYKQGMTLGSDVTAYYGADLKGVARAVTVDTPYNTRMHAGLPPGPIATPGLGALDAVASPAAGDYIYFVSGDDGKTYFARTNAEHEANVSNHCHTLCAMD